MATSEVPPTFTPFPGQVPLFDALTDGVHRIIGYGGSIRSGKSYAIFAAIVLLCRIFPRSRWAIVRKDLPRLRTNTIPSFQKFCDQALGNKFVGPINQSTWTARCDNGSEILFFSESLDVDPDLSRWKGLEVNGFGLEEADELSDRSYIKALERAGAWIVPPVTQGGVAQQPPPFILCTFNPSAGWPKRVFYEPWKNGTMAPPYLFVPALPRDNPYVSEEQREAWKIMPAHEYRRFVEGDWEVLSGRYYEGLNAAMHLRSRADLNLPDELPDWWEYWGAFDWGYAHWAVFGSFVKTNSGQIVLLDSIWMRKEQDADMASTIKHTVPHPHVLKEVYAGHDCWNKVTAHGAQGITTAQIFYEYGIWLSKADTDRINGGRALRRALSPSASNGGAPLFVMVDTPGNRRVYDSMAEILPDENNVNKPGKVDCDMEGRGGDDGADLARYGIATRVPMPIEPAAHWKPHFTQDPNRWQEQAGVESGRVYDGGYAAQLPVHW